MLLLPRRSQGADRGLARGLTQLYLSDLCDLGLVVSLHSMETDIRHLS